jgi:uncharacterized protein YdeI (YjbR/CyaY-like superfamily)
VTPDAELVTAKDRASWRRWLQRNHTQDVGIWLELHKKGSAGSSVRYVEAVEEGLCFGWIDSTANTLDEERYAIWFAPRKAKSAWSATNKERVDRMVAAGLMTEAGLEAIEIAKENGAWDALNDSDALMVPDDLASALAANGDARRHWDAFPPGVRKQILEWINSAKRDETRAKRVAETATSAAKNVRAHQWRPKT